MMDILLLTGFLGAGKTTLLHRMLEQCGTHRIGVIVNDFGAINVDAKLVQKDGITLLELSNGSIFCACIQDKFVTGLIEMSARDLDYLFIEASGLSDPANMETLLEGIRSQTAQPLRLYASICVVDAEYFLDLVDVLPALERQAAYADIVIVNKADLAGQALLEETGHKLQAINPDASVCFTSYCRVDPQALLDGLQRKVHPPEESTNTPASRPSGFTLRCTAALPLDGLEAFLRAVAPDTYRIKGFALTDLGPKSVSVVRERIQITDWPERLEETELVVISAVGVRLVSRMLEASRRYLGGMLRL